MAAYIPLTAQYFACANPREAAQTLQHVNTVFRFAKFCRVVVSGKRLINMQPANAALQQRCITTIVNLLNAEEPEESPGQHMHNARGVLGLETDYNYWVDYCCEQGMVFITSNKYYDDDEAIEDNFGDDIADLLHD